MSLFAAALADAADTQDIQAGGTGFLSELGNALTAGTAGAVISGLGSIYNTFAAGANALGASVEEIDTYKKLAEIDLNWAEYYKKNETAIDVVGFIGSSLIPGTLAIKGLNAVRAGNANNAFGRALGFAKTKQAQYLDEAMKELATEGGTIFTKINKNKMAAMGWGFADQTLTAAAFEVGVALTMKQSPLLADDNWWDIGKSIVVGSLLGGAIGGSIDSIILNRGFKDALKNIETKQRDYDYINVYNELNLAGGDKAFGVMDSLLRMPKEVEAMAGFVKIPEIIASRSASGAKFMDVGKLLTDALKGAQKTAMQDFEAAIREIGKSDSEVAAGLADYITQRFAKLQASNASPSVIADEMGSILHLMKSAKPATERMPVASDDLWYFTKAISPEEMAKIKTIEDWKKAFVSHTPIPVDAGGNAYSKPYIFLGTTEDMKRVFSEAARIGRPLDEGGYPSLAAAWKDGKDVAFMPDGTVRVNDRSKHWRRVNDPVYDTHRFLNTRTGAVTHDSVLTAADRFPAGMRLADSIRGNTVEIFSKVGKDTSKRVINMDKPFDKVDLDDTEYWTARHAWAAKLKDNQLPEVVDVTDFSLMDRLRTVKDEKVKETIEIYSGDTLLGTLNEIDLEAAIKNAKLGFAQATLGDAFGAGKEIDLRTLAYRLNSDAKWVENAIASRFANSLAGEVSMYGKTITNTDGLSRNLEEYLRRENIIVDYARPQQFQELGYIRPNMKWPEKRLLILDQIAMTGGQFVTGELAWAYRVQAAVQATKTAAAAVQGSARVNQLIDLSQDAAKLADSLGIGASFFGSSNANYGELLKLWAQNTGKLVHGWINEDLKAVVDSFSTVSNRLLQDKTAAAELGIVTNLLRGTDEKYVWNPDNPKQLMLRELKGLKGDKLSAKIQSLTDEGRKLYIDIENDVTVEFLKLHTGINADRVAKKKVLVNARGMTSNYQEDTVYVPPIDTTYFKHFAFVRPVDGKAFGTSEVTMIFGRDAVELNSRIAQVDKTNFEVITKSDTEKFFKAKGQYDFEQTINEPRINSELKRTGALTNFFPEVRPENLVEDYLRWHQNQTARLVRDSVETYYAQQIAELRKLGESYVKVATSKFSGTLRSSKSEIVNPYDDYVKTALDISKRSEYSFFHQANEFIDALGTRAYQAVQSAFYDARKGIVTWQEANAIAEKHGIRGMYQSEADFFVSNTPRDRNLIKEYITKANMLLANFVLRFDFANSLINVISTPLLLSTELASIRTLAKNDPALVGKLAELQSVAVPGTNGALTVPSQLKLLHGAIKNFFGPDRQQLLTRYRANGDIKTVMDEYHEMLDSLAMRADFKAFSAGVDKAFEKVANFTGNTWAEEFTRFVSADVMRQLSDPLVEAGKLTLKEQNAYISTFVNRVQGNYISSQRPIVFQGVLGAAVGLFQTYSFNLLQQLLRHVGNRDKRAVATMYGMQSGLFGLNGTPMFEAINTHIIGNAAINDGHYDAYSLAPAILGKDVGDWLMYGTASAFPAFGDKWPSLYTRGDINPRHISILPITPGDVPAIDASIRVVRNLADTFSKLLGGADVSTTMLQGLEHNGINRPLAGFAQAVTGQSTTSKAGLISASSDFSLIATAARIAGSRPMDESIALNGFYRNKAYQAADRDRMEHLGERVKTHLYKGEFPPDDVIDGFMKDYAAAGGRVENFNAAMQRWAKDANISVVDKMRAKMNSSYGQRLNEIMGGEPLEDSRAQMGQSEILTPE